MQLVQAAGLALGIELGCSIWGKKYLERKWASQSQLRIAAVICICIARSQGTIAPAVFLFVVGEGMTYRSQFAYCYGEYVGLALGIYLSISHE